MLEVSDVHKSYGSLKVIKGVTFEVAKGDTFAIIGPNGAGKTTMFKVITGEVKRDSGTIRYKGEDVSDKTEFERVRLGMGRTFQVARTYPDVTVLDNIVVAIEVRRAARNENAPHWYNVSLRADIVAEAEEHLRDLGLSDKRDMEARFLSHGDKKRLELGLALAGMPEVLMLDEPTAGMSPQDRHATTELILRLREEKKMTVVITEHDMDVIFELASRILVLNHGEALAVGTIEEIRANPLVQDVYLGKEMYSAEG
ncbi:MAG: ABC transporter ATP-binding protein [Rhizobiaceae bacterium]|nr:ABC transporter ATP-binding protein [Rhizobiaceae bacterium]